MKLRGLYPIVAVLILAGALLLGPRYLNSTNSPSLNDTKSQLTAVNSVKKKALQLQEIIAKNTEKKQEMTERVDFANNDVLLQERSYTEAEISNMSEADFKILLKEVEQKLPKNSEIKTLPAHALHHTPTAVLVAGRELGLLKEILKVHENYEKLAIDFYQQCAKNNERPTPVRALCLTNIITIKKKNGESINLAQYPEKLVELTKLVTDL